MDIKNTTEILAFKLKSYYSGIPVYAVVLDFMFETGGIF